MELKSINFYEFKEQCVNRNVLCLQIEQKISIQGMRYVCYQELEKDYFNFDKASVLIRDWD